MKYKAFDLSSYKPVFYHLTEAVILSLTSLVKIFQFFLALNLNMEIMSICEQKHTRLV